MATGLPRLVLATANPGKVAELVELLGAFEVVARPEGLAEPEEDGATLLANARIKAAAVVAATGEAAVADDTALEVVALGGGPGVHTARFGGPDRLLEALVGVEDRRATWRTVALVLWPDGTEVVAEGTCAGVVTGARRGSGGFGYDPVFVPADGDGRAFAEMSRSEKNAISHRGHAFRNLARRLS